MAECLFEIYLGLQASIFLRPRFGIKPQIKNLLRVTVNPKYMNLCLKKNFKTKFKKFDVFWSL